MSESNRGVAIKAPYLPRRCLDLGKLGIPHSLLLDVVSNDSPRPTALQTTVLENLAPLVHGAFGVNGAVVAGDKARWFHTLQVSPGLKADVGLSEELGPVGNAPPKEAYVYVIKRIGGKGPRETAIIDLATDAL